MIHPRYVPVFIGGLIFWFGLYLGFTWFVDPYRVAPFKILSNERNLHKPKLINIDRLIKPYEVWKNKPRTVFLGTSRIHQAIVPSRLESTRYAPAYNASIPASSLQLNASHLRNYIALDPSLKYVFVELFFYNFIERHPEEGPANILDILRDAASLFVSGDTLWASVQTLHYNLKTNLPCPEIQPGGYINYNDPRRNLYAKSNFDAFPLARGIWKFHAGHFHSGDHFSLQESAFAAVDEMVKLCKQHGVELVFILTPSTAHDDYYINEFKGMGLVEEWLTRVSIAAEAYMIPLPREVVHEPVTSRMLYWNDPYHFSFEVGGMIERAIEGIKSGQASSYTAIRMTPDSVARHMQQRREDLSDWRKKNREFAAVFETERLWWETSRSLNFR